MSASGGVVAVRAEPVVRDFDPLLDKSYRDTGLGPDVVAWLGFLELSDKSDRTLDQYERDMARLCLMYPSKGVSEITTDDLMQAARSWPKKSRRVRVEALKSFFRWAYLDRRIAENPTGRLPQIKATPKKVIDVFSTAEVDDLLALPQIDGVLMALLFGGGLRKSEARMLQVRRCKLQPDPELIVIGGKGDKDRVVPLGSRWAASLEGFLTMNLLNPQDFLWYSKPGGHHVSRAKPINDSSFNHWWVRSLKTAGVRYRNPHTARHTFATEWLRRGGRLETLSMVMGHASIRTTFDLYGHMDNRDVRADLLLMEAAR